MKKLKEILNGNGSNFNTRDELVSTFERINDWLVELYFESDSEDVAEEIEGLMDEYIRRAVKELTEDNWAVFLNGATETLLTKSARFDGYQLTYFNKTGVLMHKDMNTYEEAIELVVKERMIPLKKEFIKYVK